MQVGARPVLMHVCIDWLMACLSVLFFANATCDRVSHSLVGWLLLSGQRPGYDAVEWACCFCLYWVHTARPVQCCLCILLVMVNWHAIVEEATASSKPQWGSLQFGNMYCQRLAIGVGPPWANAGQKIGLWVFRDCVQHLLPRRKPCRIWQESREAIGNAAINWGFDPVALQSPFYGRADERNRQTKSVRLSGLGIGAPTLNKYFVDLACCPTMLFAWVLKKATAPITGRNKFTEKYACQSFMSTMVAQALMDSDVQVAPTVLLSVDPRGVTDPTPIFDAVLKDCCRSDLDYTALWAQVRQSWQVASTASSADGASEEMWVGQYINKCKVGTAIVFIADFFGFEACTTGMNALTSVMSAIARALVYRTLTVATGTAGDEGNSAGKFATETGRTQTGARIAFQDSRIRTLVLCEYRLSVSLLDVCPCFVSACICPALST